MMRRWVMHVGLLVWCRIRLTLCPIQTKSQVVDNKAAHNDRNTDNLFASVSFGMS